MKNALPSYISGGQEAAPWAMFLEQIARLEPAPWQVVGMARYVAPLASCDDATFGLFLPD